MRHQTTVDLNIFKGLRGFVRHEQVRDSPTVLGRPFVIFFEMGTAILNGGTNSRLRMMRGRLFNGRDEEQNRQAESDGSDNGYEAPRGRFS